MTKLTPEKLLGLQGLLLLTKSSDTDDVAEAFVKTLGIDDALDLMWALGRHLPVSFPIAYEIRDLENHFDDADQYDVEHGDLEAVRSIDRTKMPLVTQIIQDTDCTRGNIMDDSFADVRDSLIAALEEGGCIVPKEPPNEAIPDPQGPADAQVQAPQDAQQETRTQPTRVP